MVLSTIRSFDTGSETDQVNPSLSLVKVWQALLPTFARSPWHPSSVA